MREDTELKLAIIELDGCIFPLNRLRYNFYKNICKKRNITVTADEFYHALGNMYSMYETLPLATTLNSQKLNTTVEKDLYNYLSMKGLSPKDGVIELFEYFRQNNIPIAVVSTHKTKTAINYLELGSLYRKVDYVIGCDTDITPLPSEELLAYIDKRFQVTPKDTLVITSMNGILHSANKIGMNTIYLNDLVEAGDDEISCSYQVANSMYEALNDILFGRYEDYKIFEPLLGMDKEMSVAKLKALFANLQEVYKDDPDLLKIIKSTYISKLSELTRERPRRFTFNDEDLAELEKEESEPVVEEEKEEEPTALSLNAHDTAALNDVIAKVMEAEKNPPKEEEEDKEDPVVEEPKKKPDHHIINTFINISYVLLLSLMILLLGLVVHIALGNMMDQPVVQVLHSISLGYVEIAETIFRVIIDGLHSITNAVPDYYTYMNDNTVMTLSALKMVHCYVLNVVVVTLIETIKYFTLKKKGS
ncbi:HAD hydrolase-like protein [uncultured Catenibacterium sp.]|uniref:HAD hydrolase-like protein n=1 Tax=uncultured Catenibacterium sp. TaxID=286142 RepID=UPI0025D54091|nr:HAD hydrolase-like protein [uncultured Catenibacterium sp.]